MSDLAAGCPDCKKHLEEITELTAKIAKLEAKCGAPNSRREITCMLSPRHEGSHRYWDRNSQIAWGG